MLTRAQHRQARRDLNNKNWALGIPVALCCSACMAYVLIDGFATSSCPTRRGADLHPAGQRLIFEPFLMPFWALSFVLLAAVIGAIVLARKD